MLSSINSERLFELLNGLHITERLLMLILMQHTAMCRKAS